MNLDNYPWVPAGTPMWDNFASYAVRSSVGRGRCRWFVLCMDHPWHVHVHGCRAHLPMPPPPLLPLLVLCLVRPDACRRP